MSPQEPEVTKVLEEKAARRPCFFVQSTQRCCVVGGAPVTSLSKELKPVSDRGATLCSAPRFGTASHSGTKFLPQCRIERGTWTWQAGQKIRQGRQEALGEHSRDACHRKGVRIRLQTLKPAMLSPKTRRSDTRPSHANSCMLVRARASNEYMT